MKSILAMVVIATLQLFVADRSREMSVALAADIQSKPQSNAQMKADCITASKRGSMGVKDREYLPVYSTRSVSRGSSGYHCWTVDNYSPFGLHWSSDASNAMNDFIVFQYDVSSTKQVTLELKGGWISFSNNSEKGYPLYLAVYDGSPPESLFKDFKDKESDFKKSKPSYVGKPWFRPDNTNYVKIDPLTISLPVRKSTLSVVLLGVDSWPNTSVRVEIVGLRLVSRMPLQTKTQMKK
jgi:hypothetical protein